MGNTVDVLPVRPGGHDVDLTITSSKSLATPAFSGSDSNLDKEFLGTWTILIDHVIRVGDPGIPARVLPGYSRKKWYPEPGIFYRNRPGICILKNQLFS